MRDNLDMSVVFKLSSVEDLGRLHKALKTALTFQEEIKLKADIKELKELKYRLRSEIQGLRAEIVKIDPTRAEEKPTQKDTKYEEGETEMPESDEEESNQLTDGATEPALGE